MADRPLPAYDGDESYLFVSYSHEDDDLVYAEIRWLQDQGCNVWWDEGISPGHNWPEDLAHAIEHCTAFVLFVSPRSVASANCTRETNFAQSNAKPIIAIHLEETVLPSGLALTLGDTQAIFSYAIALEAYRRKLEEALHEFVRPVAEPVREIPTSRKAPNTGLVTLATALIVIAAIGIWIVLTPRGPDPAELDTVRALAADAEVLSAYAALQTLQDEHPDADLGDLWGIVTRPGTILSDPTGAEVSIRPLDGGEWLSIGTTPLEAVHIPLGDFTFRFEIPNRPPREIFRANPSAGFGNSRFGRSPPRPIDLSTTPESFEPVPESGIFFAAQSNYILEPSRVPRFEIQRGEVTNDEFKAFVDAGGYEASEYWQDLDFLVDGRSVDWAEARTRFVDRTGRLGPSTWELGTYPAGKAMNPVNGISWYEAMAYARFRDADLPTVHHWSTIAQPLFASKLVGLSNFDGVETQRVDSGVSGYHGTRGTYGNVREWLQNSSGNLRWIMGGGWRDPTYIAAMPQAIAPLDRGSNNGLRLARYPVEFPAGFAADRPVTYNDYRLKTPVSDDAFAVIRERFVDRGPAGLDPQVDYSKPEGDWRHERITLTSDLPDERIIVHLYLPLGETPPYQGVVVFPALGDFNPGDSEVRGLAVPIFGWIPRSGRALVRIVFHGALERYSGINEAPPEQRSIRQTDLREHWYADTKRTLDYLSTRSDIDMTRIAYFGWSYGASHMVPVLAMEKRFKVAVLVDGGLGNLGVNPMPTGADTINFAPRIKVPVLMLNGRDDMVFPLQTNQIPLFQLLGTSDSEKQHILFDGGHYDIPRTEVIRTTADWLDQHLGKP